MSALRFILADQLSMSIASLDSLDKTNDTVMLCEVMGEATYVRHHQKKIAFLFSAMRHFASELLLNGVKVRYVKLDDDSNTGSLLNEITRAIKELSPTKVVLTKPGEYRVMEIMNLIQKNSLIPVEIKADTRFLATHEFFYNWAKDKKEIRMEYFYREMRKKHKILIEKDGLPTGGLWNYDKENRKPPKTNMTFPVRINHEKSKIVEDVLALVKNNFGHHFGNLETFNLAVTRKQALIELDYFIDNLLPNFGDYQDAMLKGEPYLFHSGLSTYLNAGLLLPIELCHKAELAYSSGKVPINAAEGFIRQVLGWREYIRGIYWYLMPDYGERNALNANRKLPQFYWNAKTNMNCLAEAVKHTSQYAYSHHIQRLMVTGNFALIAGLDVKQVQDWYLSVYSDAYEWVEMPNTLGMSLFGDGGVVASKPYASSGKYVNKMSNYCKDCKYSPESTIDDNSCPFNSLYWDFMVRNKDLLIHNQRLKLPFSMWSKFDTEKQNAILTKARKILLELEDNLL